jgi:hypothetical protein
LECVELFQLEQRKGNELVIAFPLENEFLSSEHLFYVFLLFINQQGELVDCVERQIVESAPNWRTNVKLKLLCRRRTSSKSTL